jgi:hypothetical protein
MLAAKLVRLLEMHADEIARSVVREIERDPRMRTLASLPQSDLTDRCTTVLNRLSEWLYEADETKVRAEFEALGRTRAGQGVPLAELILRIQTLKQKMFAYVREHSFRGDALDLYAEDELHRSLSRFFDAVTYFAARGYEAAQVEAERVAARAAP